MLYATAFLYLVCTVLVQVTNSVIVVIINDFPFDIDRSLPKKYVKT